MAAMGTVDKDKGIHMEMDTVPYRVLAWVADHLQGLRVELGQPVVHCLVLAVGPC